MALSDPSNLTGESSPRVSGSLPAKPKDPPSLDNLSTAAGGDENTDPQEVQNQHHAGGFWNQPWVQNVLPLATSLVFHVTIIAVGILLWKAAPLLINPNKDQVIIPESKSIEKNAMPGGIEHPGLNSDKTRDAAQDLTKDTDDKGFSTSVSNNMAASGGPGSEESSFEGAKASSGNASNAFGGGAGGGTAPWGVPGGGGGLLPKSNFMGTGGNATKIIYLCDASGSMLSVFGALKQQLKESVNSLDVTAGQEFNVIFFYDDVCDPLFKDHQMHLASPANKKLAMEFIDNAVSTGGTQPIPAIKEAMHEKPELLYVETDGFDAIASFDDVINAFKDGNTDGKMHINCIFLQADEDPKLEKVLSQIARQGNGAFRKILKSDM
jgi:hypothetical protein